MVDVAEYYVSCIGCITEGEHGWRWWCAGTGLGTREDDTIEVERATTGICSVDPRNLGDPGTWFGLCTAAAVYPWPASLHAATLVDTWVPRGPPGTSVSPRARSIPDSGTPCGAPSAMPGCRWTPGG